MSFFRWSNDMCSQSTFLAAPAFGAGAGSAARAAPIHTKARDSRARDDRASERFIETPCLVDIDTRRLAPTRASPRLHAAIEHDVYSGDVRALSGGQEKSHVRH